MKMKMFVFIQLVSLHFFAGTVLAGTVEVQMYAKGDINAILPSTGYHISRIDEDGKLIVEKDPGVGWNNKDEAQKDGRDVHTVTQERGITTHLIYIKPTPAYPHPTQSRSLIATNTDGPAFLILQMNMKTVRDGHDWVRLFFRNPDTKKLVSVTRCERGQVGAFQYGNVKFDYCLTYTEEFCSKVLKQNSDLHKMTDLTKVDGVQKKILESWEAENSTTQGPIAVINGAIKWNLPDSPTFGSQIKVSGGPLQGVAASIGAQLGVYGPKSQYENTMARLYFIGEVASYCEELGERGMFLVPKLK